MLSFVSLKDWLYIGIILVVSGIFAFYTFHERSIGRHEIEALDKRAVDARKVRDDEIDKRAAVLVQDALSKYKTSISAPTGPTPQLVCVTAKPRNSGRVSANEGSPNGSNGETQLPEEDNIPFNPAPAVIEDGRDADSQVILLQDYIKACQAVGKCSKN